MKGAPIIAVLDLWSLGHSGSQIAEMLGLGRRQVGRIIDSAREIADPRAGLHVTVMYRPTGSAAKAKALLVRRPKLEVIPLISRAKPRVRPEPKERIKTHCRRGGHPLVTTASGRRNCTICHNADRRMRYVRKADR